MRRKFKIQRCARAIIVFRLHYYFGEVLQKAAYADSRTLMAPFGSSIIPILKRKGFRQGFAYCFAIAPLGFGLIE